MRARENSHSSPANERADKAVVPAMPPKKGRKVKNATNAASTDQLPLHGSDTTTDGYHQSTDHQYGLLSTTSAAEVTT
jgi:hypothetical protein